MYYKVLDKMYIIRISLIKPVVKKALYTQAR